MAINREELHKIIDGIPSHKLPQIADLLRSLYPDVEELNLDEEKEVAEAQKRIAKSEYITLAELLQKYGNAKDV